MPRTLLVLACALLLGAGETPSQARQLVVVAGPLSADALPALTKHLDFYGDFGHLAVGEGDLAAVTALRDLGYAVSALGAWPEGRPVLVTPVDFGPVDGERVHAEHGAQRLLSVPQAVAASDPRLAHGCGAHLFATVKRQAFRPALPFVAPAPDSHPFGNPSGTAGNNAILAVDDRIAPLVSQVDGSNIQATVAQLSSYFTRRADSAQILLAKDWLVAQFEAIPGLTVSTHTFGPEAPNVVAELTGSTHPERVIVLGAHYDSINGDGSSFPAPGADDNASGSGGVLEAARVLAQGEYENTIRFVLFSAEEFGLVGAGAYAADLLLEPGVQPVAMLNLDMIAHREAGDIADLDFATNNTDPALTQFCRDAAAAYVPGLPTVTGTLTSGSSDHAAFQGQGIPAAFFFEDLDEFSSVIHTSADVLGSSANDFNLAEDITAAFVASAAELAQPVDLSVVHVAFADTSDAGGPYLLDTTVTSLTAAGVSGIDVFWRVDGGAWASQPLLAGNDADSWVGSLPGVGDQGIVEYYFVGQDDEGHLEWLPEAIEAGGSVFTFTAATIVSHVSDDFESVGDNGWTHQEFATQDDWQHDEPQGKAGDPGAAFSGTRIWGNDLGPTGFNGAYQPDVDNILRSPTYDLSGQSDVHLRFRRWLTVEDGFFDQATILVDGSPVWTNPATPGGGSDNLIDTAWSLQDIDISALADNDSSVQVSFQLESDGGLEFGGWNIDDLQLASVTPGNVAPLVASGRYISSTGGGSIDFNIDMPSDAAGRTYLVLISVSGTDPGTPVDFVTVPINFDAVTQVGIGLLGTPTAPGFFGTLDGNGDATATFNTPPVSIPELPGLRLQLAALTMFPADVTTNAVEVEFVP